MKLRVCSEWKKKHIHATALYTELQPVFCNQPYLIQLKMRKKNYLFEYNTQFQIAFSFF